MTSEEARERLKTFIQGPIGYSDGHEPLRAAIRQLLAENERLGDSEETVELDGIWSVKITDDGCRIHDGNGKEAHRSVNWSTTAVHLTMSLSERRRLSAKVAALEASIASAVCQGCGHKTIHDKGVALHWCEECVAGKVAALEAKVREYIADRNTVSLLCRLLSINDHDPLVQRTSIAEEVAALEAEKTAKDAEIERLKNAGAALLDELATLRAELEIVKHDRDCALKGEEELESELAAERTAREQAQAGAARYRNALYQIGCGKETWTREQMIDVAVEQLASNAESNAP